MGKIKKRHEKFFREWNEQKASEKQGERKVKTLKESEIDVYRAMSESGGGRRRMSEVKYALIGNKLYDCDTKEDLHALIDAWNCEGFNKKTYWIYKSVVLQGR